MVKSDATTDREGVSAAHGDVAARDKTTTEADSASAKQHEATASATPSQAEINPPEAEASLPRQAAAREVCPSGGRVPRGSEIELKLLVDSDHMADFTAAPVITANARNKGTRKHLKSAYFDAPKRSLKRNGLSLRVRQSGARYVQTVKADFADDPLRRGEWEANVSSMAPDVGLAMPFIPPELCSDLDHLEEVFTSDIHRHARIVDLPSGTVEVAFDQGVLRSGDRSMPVSEIELELKSGGTVAIYDLALRLAEHGPLRPSIRSKSARGFDLASDAGPAARKPRKIRLDPSTPLDEAFATILRACLHHLLESIPAAEDGRYPEGIHQLRVALRRLRSALDLMRSVGPLSRLDSLRSEAKWLAQNLSAARDWDIFQQETLPTVAKACPTVAGFDALKQAAEKRRQAAYRKVRRALADRRCSHFLISLGGWIEARGWRDSEVAPEDLGRLAAPAISFAGEVLSGQFAKVLKRGRRFKSLGVNELHRLRLAAKKLRYLADFLLPLYDDRKSVKQFFRKLAGLQEELGCYNDMAVTASLLDGLDAEAAEGDIAGAVIAGWQAHAAIGVAPRLRSSWRDFTKAKAPWVSEADA